MVSLTSLWLPILLSAVAVFIVSAIIHMFLPYHRGDFRKLPAEDAIMSALLPHNIAPGDYMFPHATSPSAMKDPAWAEKRKRGPVGILTVLPTAQMGMGKNLTLWFVYSVIVSLFSAYLASHALPAGADAAEIFRYVATLGFMGYGMALIHDSVWFGREWSSTVKSLFDAFVYGAVTAAVFIWMWPKP
jgi:hypothetical protein